MQAACVSLLKAAKHTFEKLHEGFQVLQFSVMPPVCFAALSSQLNILCLGLMGRWGIFGESIWSSPTCFISWGYTVTPTYLLLPCVIKTLFSSLLHFGCEKAVGHTLVSVQIFLLAIHENLLYLFQSCQVGWLRAIPHYNDWEHMAESIWRKRKLCKNTMTFKRKHMNEIETYRKWREKEKTSPTVIRDSN